LEAWFVNNWLISPFGSKDSFHKFQHSVVDSHNQDLFLHKSSSYWVSWWNLSSIGFDGTYLITIMTWTWVHSVFSEIYNLKT
jgi:hypothetical protein